MNFSQQPLQGSDIAAFVFAVLALLFFVLWRRDQERGMVWLAGAYAVLACRYALDAQMLTTDVLVQPMSAVLLGVGGLLLNCGLLYYLASPRNPQRWRLTLVIALALIMPLLMLFGVLITRPWAHLPYALSLVLVVQATFEAARREPQAGHIWLALGMLAIPAVMVVSTVLKGNSVGVRYYIMPPALFFGIMLLTVSVLRRSRALQAEIAQRQDAERSLTALNASLEATVASRTADLQNMVAGLESFNRSVSHDLQGSLGGMAGLARVAQDAVQPESCDLALARRVLPLIVTEAERSTELVSALLTLARVGDQHVNKTAVDLNTLTQEVIASVSLGKLGAALPRFIINALPSVHADINLLRPALSNLIGNAVKFCGYRPQGSVDVLARVDAATKETIIQVRDNGIGFCDTSAGKLFQPFVRLHGQDFAGHGVGLSIVRGAVERQGGRVWAESELGKGASFFLALPSGVAVAPILAPTPIPALPKAVALQAAA